MTVESGVGFLWRSRRAGLGNAHRVGSANVPRRTGEYLAAIPMLPEQSVLVFNFAQTPLHRESSINFSRLGAGPTEGWHARLEKWVPRKSRMSTTPSCDISLQLQEFGGCDREAIQVPGFIQPHGLLLAVDPATDLIGQAAGDAGRLLGRDDLAFGDSLLGLTMEEVLGASLVGFLKTGTLFREPIYLGTVGPFGDRGPLAVTAHQTLGVAIVEAQLSLPTAAFGATTLAEIRYMTERVGGAPDLLAACALATGEIRRITDYDRVMVYQFLPDGSGTVIAEQRDEHLRPYLNHRYPAADIPLQARELYRRSMIRVIPDVFYSPEPLAPALSPATHQALDMSYCLLRSVSPVHVRYLKNMGVGASMSVSLLLRDELWGLIACHNTTPRIVPYEAQEACRHVGQILSQKIVAQQEAKAIASRMIWTSLNITFWVSWLCQVTRVPRS